MSRALVIKGADFESNRVEQITFDSEKHCTAVEFDESSYTVVSKTTPTAVSVTKIPADTTDELVLTVADQTIAKVENGYLIPVKFGTTTITATCGNATATATISVPYIEVVPEQASDKRVQSIDSWSGTKPITFSSNASYDAIFVTQEDPLDHSSIFGSPSGKGVIKIPAGTVKIELVSTQYKGYSARMRYTSTTSPATDDNLYAGYISMENVVDGNSDGIADTTNIPAGCDSFAIEIGHNSNEYSFKIVFYNSVS